MNEPDPIDRESSGEDIVDRYLNTLPEIPAPASLVVRVHAAIAARTALPWWRHSYHSWPWLPQYLMVATSVLFLFGISWGISHVAVIWNGIENQAFPLLAALTKPFLLLLSNALSLVLGLVTESSMTILYVLGGMATLGYFVVVGAGACLCRIVQLQNAR